MTQNERIIAHLKEHGSISRREAFEEYGIANLPARITDLRKQGYNIETHDIKITNRYGEKTSFARYFLGVKA